MLSITRVSSFTGKENTMNIDVTEEQIKKWENGMLIQNAMPQLSPEEREFIKSGVTPKEWDQEFGSPN